MDLAGSARRAGRTAAVADGSSPGWKAAVEDERHDSRHLDGESGSLFGDASEVLSPEIAAPAGLSSGRPVPDLDELMSMAEQLADRARGRPEARRAVELGTRLRTGRFVVSVVGEFKRGKSTLVNALLREEVVPTGVLPLTAVSTEMSYGEPSATVEHLDGSCRQIDRGSLAEYVTEELNPGNTKQVARVTLTGRWPLLRGGVVLVDTPGVGSIHQHNTEAARQALLDADGAVVVFSADSPLSDTERNMLVELRARQARTFFVLNKVDHLDSGEAERVIAFVSKAVADSLGHAAPIYALNARAARDRLDRAADPFQFGEFQRALSCFFADDLVGAQIGRARFELAQVGRSLQGSLRLEEAALAVSVEELDRLTAIFAAAASQQRDGFVDDRTILRRDVAKITASAREELAHWAHQIAPHYFPALDAAAPGVDTRRLQTELRHIIETSVKDAFGAGRDEQSSRVDRAWIGVAEKFRSHTEDRVAALRSAAAELFTIELPKLDIPTVTSLRDQFSYLFLHVGSSTDLLVDVASVLVPTRIARRRAVRSAKKELVGEFDKHAGRASWDLAQRLDQARHELERSMAEQVDATIAGIEVASARATQRRQAAQGEQVRWAEETERLAGLAERLVALEPV
jgi:GTP-binding protein EngB required for normal cell division